MLKLSTIYIIRILNIMDYEGNLEDYPALRYADDVKAICDPFLKLLDLNYFGYFRIYQNAEVVGLLTDPYWFEHFVTNKYAYQSGRKLTEGAHLWVNSHSDIITNNARNYFNHDHGLFIITEKEGYTESAIFATHAGNDAVLENYINKLDLLKLFINFFQHEAHALLLKASNHRLILNTALNPKNIAHPKNMDDALKLFFAKQNGKSLFINDKKIQLTKRESDCLISLCQGNSAKMIAKEFDLSPRTVEIYISQLRSKFNCGSSRELVKTTLEHFDLFFLKNL